jgi:adenine phosphoribosyltransferase
MGLLKDLVVGPLPGGPKAAVQADIGKRQRAMAGIGTLGCIDRPKFHLFTPHQQEDMVYLPTQYIFYRTFPLPFLLVRRACAIIPGVLGSSPRDNESGCAGRQTIIAFLPLRNYPFSQGATSMSFDSRTYTVQIGALTRDLPIFAVAPNVKIAIFNMLGDTEIVEQSVDLLVSRIPADAEVILVPEVKAVPLGHALSVRSGLPYVVVRKFRKPYMVNCLETEVISITTGAPQTLYVDGKDRPLLQDKKALLVDDVISTGNTLRGMRKLVAAANGQIAGEMAVFTEGDEGQWSNIIALGNLPVFTD